MAKTKSAPTKPAPKNEPKTLPEVFILESLSFDDEKHNRYEGRILSDMLRLCGKKPEYYYFRTKEELPHLLKLFKGSKYRYLHLSCHGSDDSVCTTLDDLSYHEFAAPLEDHLKLCRLFCSACELGNKSFAQAVSDLNKGMHSIIAPACDIRFDHAAAIWAAFYTSAFGENDKAMKTRDLQTRISGLVKLFPVEFFVASYHSEKDNWKYDTIKP
jgi:hypothetical protein